MKSVEFTVLVMSLNSMGLRRRKQLMDLF